VDVPRVLRGYPYNELECRVLNPQSAVDVHKMFRGYPYKLNVNIPWTSTECDGNISLAFLKDQIEI